MMRTSMNKLILIIAMLFPLCAKAQWSFDVGSVEAYIADHKNQKSLLLARSTLEMSNQLLHEYSADATDEYKELNFDLDKYTRAFDIIDIIYQSTRTALNVRDTYTNISENVGKYKRMLTDFHEKMSQPWQHRTVGHADYYRQSKMLKKIGNEAEHLYRSMTDLVLYATGAAACSTSDLMTVLNSINRSLDNIRLNLNTAYFDTWRYIQVRIGYWKVSVYRNKSLREIIDDAFGRWRGAGYLNYNNQ